MIDWSQYPNFSETEFACQCGCGRADMDPEFMGFIQAVRTRARVPMPVSSGFRCPDHNARVSKTGRDGPHTTGKAADFAVRGSEAYRVLSVALASISASGIGIQQKGSARFLHLDILENHETSGPRPWIWSY